MHLKILIDTFKKDIYKEARGTYSRILDLFCRVCDNKVLTYQKDGPGNLRRLYFDRIISPEELTNLESKSLDEVLTLSCSDCEEDIGMLYIYKKENRKAFKVYQDAATKKVRKLKDISK